MECLSYHVSHSVKKKNMMLERFADAIAAKAVSVLHAVVQAVSVLQLLYFTDFHDFS